MKVSLINTPIGGIVGLEMITFVEPLGLECVAASLEPEGHECQIIDMRIENLETGLAKMKAFKPDIIGITCIFTTQRYRVIRMAQLVKREFPEAMIMVGGHDVSRDPQWFVRPGVDVCAVGDGEEVVPDLVRTYAEDGDLSQVPGLVLNTPDGPVATGPAPSRRPLNELPMPARHLIEDYKDEYYMNFHRPLALVETARGCPFRCNFCSVWKFHEGSFREKSPERVVEELSKVDSPNVFFTDDIFWMNYRRAKELGKAIAATGIKRHYNIQTRTDIITRFPDLIETWKECGKLTIFLGLEKVDDEGLASVNKNNTAANNNRAIEIVQETGVGYCPNFIVDPSWDRKDFDKVKRWIDKTGAYAAGFSIITPLPGTDLWDQVKGDVTTEDWELYDIAHTVFPTRLPLHEFYKEYCGLWSHAMDVRMRIRGRLRTQLEILAALATRKVTVKAMRKG
ncbi:MAG: cobalamin-dependent protein, partial [Verrucomicrobiae bacterium]|nr:cobalamin-dependent protein [Verrucomicrobiae bacterium]